MHVFLSFSEPPCHDTRQNKVLGATAEDEMQKQSVLANIKATYAEPALEGVFSFIGVSFCDSVLRAS